MTIPTAASVKKNIDQTLSDTLSKAKFDQWTKRWNLKSQAYMDSSKINYFSMPLIDLNEFLGESPSAARFYIGLDSTKNNTYIPHIILVGTSANGDPRLNAPFHIYDVTTVCPPVCGHN